MDDNRSPGRSLHTGFRDGTIIQARVHSRPSIEVVAVRILPGIMIITFTLALVGCANPSRSGRGAFGQPSGTAPQPFLGIPPSSSPTKGSPTKEPRDGFEPTNLTSTGSKRSGYLAGQVLDINSNLRPGAIIQVIDLESSPQDSANLSIKTNREGYFDIGGLEAGRNYRLVARLRDGNRVLMGSVRVVAPNIRVAIYLDDEVTVPAVPARETEATAGTIAVPPPPSTERKPGTAATIGPPVRQSGEGVTTPLPGEAGASTKEEPSGNSPPAIRTNPDASLLAEKDRDNVEGTTRPLPSPTVTIPGNGHTPEKTPPSNPSMEGPPGVAPAVPAPPSEEKSEEMTTANTVVPSCVRIGNRVDNFALYSRSGKPWELQKNRKGKLILLDFWFTACGPCRASIPKLNELQSKYGKHGLEIIGIAYEAGSTLPEKESTLSAGMRRHNLRITYPILFGGGGAKGNCPVAEQLDVHRFPTLILLDEKGKIIWRQQGLDEYSKYQLEVTIYQKLFPRRVVSQRP